MRRWLPFLVPFLAIVTVGGGATAYLRTAPEERGTPVETTLDELDLTQRFVRVRATAHYTATVTQSYPGNLLFDPRTYYLFPIFPEYHEEARSIRVFVRTQRRPEDLVSYEVMTVEGRLMRATPEVLPYEVQVTLDKETDYFLADEVLVIEAWRVESGEEVWELPP